MYQCLSNILKKLSADLTRFDAPEKGKYTIDNPVTSMKVPSTTPDKGESEASDEKEGKAKAKPQIDVQERDVREAKRPDVRKPRREEAHKLKWKGEGSREVRKDYQKEYRMNNGNK